VGLSGGVELYGFYGGGGCGAPFPVPASWAFVGVWTWLGGVAGVYLAYFFGNVEDECFEVLCEWDFGEVAGFGVVDVAPLDGAAVLGLGG